MDLEARSPEFQLGTYLALSVSLGKSFYLSEHHSLLCQRGTEQYLPHRVVKIIKLVFTSVSGICSKH